MSFCILSWFYLFTSVTTLYFFVYFKSSITFHKFLLAANIFQFRFLILNQQIWKFAFLRTNAYSNLILSIFLNDSRNFKYCLSIRYLFSVRSFPSFFRRQFYWKFMFKCLLQSVFWPVFWFRPQLYQDSSVSRSPLSVLISFSLAVCFLSFRRLELFIFYVFNLIFLNLKK